MHFLELKLGGGDLVFAPAQSVRIPFVFPAAVASVHALLRGFTFQRQEADMSVGHVEVSLTRLFDPTEFSTSGEIEIGFHFTGSVDRDVPGTSPLVFAEVSVLVIGS